MSLRFRKSIKIAKGLRLNVSKSGLGLSVGARGASISIGSRGAYANLGIPGTGLSVREKIGGGSTRATSSYKQNVSNINVKTIISIDDETGKETIWLETEDGRPINDESILRKIKKLDSFKNKLEEVRIKTQEEVSRKAEVLINIYKNSEKIITLEEVKSKAETLKPEKYTRKQFTVSQPSKGAIEYELNQRAKNEIKTWKFWELKKLRNEFVINNIDKIFDEEIKKWENEKSIFDEVENKKEIEENSEYLREYNEQLSLFSKIIIGDSEYIQKAFESVLLEIELPLDFSVSYQVTDSCIEIDLDLPEIESYPTNKAEILQSGKVSIKSKNKKDINGDYAKSIIGLAFYFSSIAFNISPAINRVSVAGYTQRTNKKTGNIEDQYVYKIDFDRNVFSGLNISSIEPIEAIENFNHEISISSNFELKTINL